jgi:hydrogenase expression/formation protein HypC
MCLGVPGKIVEVFESSGMKMGKIDFGGVIKEACLAYVPEAKIGDFCIIHVGLALSILNEAEATTSLETLREIAEMDKLLGSGG